MLRLSIKNKKHPRRYSGNLSPALVFFAAVPLVFAAFSQSVWGSVCDLARINLPNVVYDTTDLPPKVGGESVFLPRLEGFRDYRASVGESCPLPRFSKEGVFASGWSVGRRGPQDQFRECSPNAKEIAFFLFPGISQKRAEKAPVVKRKDYERMIKLCQSSPRTLSTLVAEAAAIGVAGNTGEFSLEACAGGDNEGFPFVAGKLRITGDPDFKRSFFFSAAVTVVGGTWGIVALLRAEELGGGVAEDTVDLANALLYLNKDHRGKIVPPTRGRPVFPWEPER